MSFVYLRRVKSLGAAHLLYLNTVIHSDADKNSTTLRHSGRVLGLGTAGIDYVAMVDHYPSPDDKVRVAAAFQTGGGNVANTLTAMSRLGVECELLTKIGQDELGSSVLNELKRDRVGTARVLRSHGTCTAYTYVIVDKETKTRTCIHTPQTEELSSDDVQDLLETGDICLVHFDSRHTLAALTLAKIANAKGIPVTVDAEKNRPPYFEQLLPLCDIIFTNERFPHLYIQQQDKSSLTTPADKIAQLFQSTRANIIVTSLGSKGSRLYLRHVGNNAASIIPSFASASLSTSSRNFAVLHEVLSTAAKDSKETLHVTRETHMGYDVMSCPAWPLADEQVVDTTGAGDAFIGGFLAALIHRMPLDQCLQVGTMCAAQKIKQPGSRKGLPTVNNLKPYKE